MSKFIENKKNKKEFYIIVAHILLGIIARFFAFIVPVYIVAVIIVYLFIYSRNDKNKVQTLIFISYITSLEILYRSTGASFLPYEISKYVQIAFVLLNLFIARTWFNSFVGILLLILMLPSLILFPPELYKYFVFNSLGLCSLAFLIAFTAYQKITFQDFASILKAFLFPCITFVTLITIKTPDLSDIEFDLGANFETTGGFGTNQVATVLGAAICFLIILTDQKKYLSSRLISICLIIYFTLRAFLSFSRGGVFGLLLSFVFSFIFFKKLRQNTIIRLGIISVALTVIFIVTNQFTEGALLLRYQGETAGTLSGSKEKDLQGISAGRLNYAEIDMALWFDNLFLGVGPGHAQFMRFKYGLYDESPPHTEVTRLFAENGIFGLFINILLIFWPVYIIYKTPSRDMKFIKSVLFIFAYATTFHSAMRTGLTPLFYGLASMDMIPENITVNKTMIGSESRLGTASKSIQ